jgi:2-iminobutanoate/2-iminopropanoate deaminase
MTHTNKDVGVSHQIGKYSDAVEVNPGMRWLFTSGTPGLETNGTLPNGISAQAELAWTHIMRMLTSANMTVSDVVRVTQYLTRAEDIAEYAKVRARFLGNSEPASMLLVIPQLVRIDFLVEVEVIAAAGI